VKKAADLADLVARLAAGEIVPLDDSVWTAVADRFTVKERIETGLSGRILLVRWPMPGARKKGWALVEDPAPREKVVRPLADEAEARALIADRLAAYERMWDG
jgi:hypothetical protein